VFVSDICTIVSLLRYTIPCYSLRIADSAKSILGDSEDPKVTWELLEKRFGAKQQGLQAVLMAKLQLSKWDGNGTIHTHRDTMVALRAELNNAGMTIDDATFYGYFTNSLPASLDLFITLYDDSTNDVDRLCDRFAQYEMQRRLADITTGKAGGSLDPANGSLALFSQQAMSSKGKGKERGRKASVAIPAMVAARRVTSCGVVQTRQRRMTSAMGRGTTGRTISPRLQRERRMRISPGRRQELSTRQ